MNLKMALPDYFAILHFTVSGNNGHLLGTDESEIAQIDLDVINTELNEVNVNIISSTIDFLYVVYSFFQHAI